MRTAIYGLAAVLSGALSACDSLTEPDGPTCTTIRLEATNLSPRVGETAHVGATPVDAAGLSVPGARVAFTSSSPAVLAVDANGGYIGLSPGAAVITAAAACGAGGAVVTSSISITVRPVLVRLVINRTGTGSGSLFNTPAGSDFDAGTAVTITANPASGSQFGGWSDRCAAFGMALSCTVTMTAPGPVTVGARFDRIEAFSSPTLTGSFGSITSSTTGCRWNLPYTGSLSLQLTQQPDGTLTGTASGTITVNVQVAYTPPFQTCTASPFTHNMAGAVSGSASNVNANAASSHNHPWRVSFTGTRSGDVLIGTVVFSGTMLESGATTTTYPVSSTINNVQLVRP